MPSGIDAVIASTEFVAAIAGAVVGALGGAVPAYLLARRASKEARKQGEAAQRERERAIAFSLYVKIAEVNNGLYTICSMINDLLYQAHLEGRQKDKLWQRLPPLAGWRDESNFRFSSDEIALLIAAKEIDLANELMILDKRYEATTNNAFEYSRRREELSRLIKTTDFEGTVGTGAIAPADQGIAKPMMVALEQVAESLIDYANRDRRQAMAAAERFGPAMRAHLKDPAFPIFELAATDWPVMEAAPTPPEPAATAVTWWQIVCNRARHYTDFLGMFRRKNGA